MGNYTKTQIVDSNALLYADIDRLIDELLAARLHNDKDGEALAMSRAEGLLVATQQQLSCVNDWLNSMEE
ncbi:MAG: hypothetical protein KBS70_08285 [Bacteroidales bacterium]|nr:hypothetical protein [Candidatus Colicola equi]